MISNIFFKANIMVAMLILVVGLNFYKKSFGMQKMQQYNEQFIIKQNENLLMLNNALKDRSLNDDQKIKYFETAKSERGLTLAIMDCALFTAILENQSLNVLSFLINSGANVNCVTKTNKTLLYFSCHVNNYNYVLFLLKCRGLRDIINLADQEKGNTPLHIACYYDNFEIVKLLADYGAKITIVNFKGKKPVNYAKDPKIINFLKRKECDYFENQMERVRSPKNFKNDNSGPDFSVFSYGDGSDLNIGFEII